MKAQLQRAHREKELASGPQLNPAHEQELQAAKAHVQEAAAASAQRVRELNTLRGGDRFPILEHLFTDNNYPGSLYYHCPATSHQDMHIPNGGRVGPCRLAHHACLQQMSQGLLMTWERSCSQASAARRP